MLVCKIDCGDCSENHSVGMTSCSKLGRKFGMGRKWGWGGGVVLKVTQILHACNIILYLSLQILGPYRTTHKSYRTQRDYI